MHHMSFGPREAIWLGGHESSTNSKVYEVTVFEGKEQKPDGEGKTGQRSYIAKLMD